jgi:hypothetical protein
VVCLGRAVSPVARHQGGEDAQASSAEPSQLLPQSDHQRHQRGLQKRHPGPQVRSPRIPVLPELQAANPLLLREARPLAATTLPLKSRKNDYLGLFGNAIGSNPEVPADQQGVIYRITYVPEATGLVYLSTAAATLFGGFARIRRALTAGDSDLACRAAPSLPRVRTAVRDATIRQHAFLWNGQRVPRT